MFWTNEWRSINSEFFESFHCWRTTINFGSENIGQILQNLAKEGPMLISSGNLYFTDWKISQKKNFKKIVENEPEEQTLCIGQAEDFPIIRDLTKSALNELIISSGALSLSKHGNRVHFFSDSTYILEKQRTKGCFRAIRGFSSDIWYDEMFHKVAINFNPAWIFDVEVSIQSWRDWIGDVVYISPSDSRFHGGRFRLISIEEKKLTAIVQRGEKRFEVALDNLHPLMNEEIIRREGLAHLFNSFVRYNQDDGIGLGTHLQEFFDNFSKLGVFHLEFSKPSKNAVAFHYVTYKEIENRISEKPLLSITDSSKIVDFKESLERRKFTPFSVPFSTAINVRPLLLSNKNEESSKILDILNDISEVCHDTFGIRLNISDPKYYDTLGSAIDTIETMKHSPINQPSVFFVLMRKRESECGLYHKLKVEFIKRRIHSQFISLDTVHRIGSHPTQTRRILMNLALGIITESGVIPWTLAEPLSEIAGIIALNQITIPTETNTEPNQSIIVCLLKREGLWVEDGIRIYPAFKATSAASEIESFHTAISDSVETLIEQSLNIDNMNRPLIIHTSKAYPARVLDTIEKSIIDNGFQEYKILRMSANSRFRFFSNNSTARAISNHGQYGFLVPGKQSFLYTKPERVIQNLPISNHLETGYEGPIEIELQRGTSALTVNDLNDIFQLTHLRYSSLDGQSYKLPISIILLKKVSDFVRCGLRQNKFSPSFFL